MIGVLIVIVITLLIALIWMYNSLIQKRNAIDNAYFSMDVMLKKRYDLIPQLVETVKGYMHHERDMLVQLTKLRQQAYSDNLDTNTKVEIDNKINASLQKLFVSFENYPQLKSSDNFLHLQRSINETEEQLAASRRFYNAAINDYHNAIEMFPTSIMGSWMGLRHKTFFSIGEEQKQVPSINFNS
jgi:LemA protein